MEVTFVLVCLAFLVLEKNALVCLQYIDILNERVDSTSSHHPDVEFVLCFSASLENIL